MSGAAGSSQWMYASGGFELEQSLKSSRPGPNNLSRTPSTGGHRQKWVFSCWIKRAQVSGNSELIFSTPGDYIGFNSNSKLNWAFNTETDGNLVTAQQFRDSGSWMHLLFVHDTTQATASNRAQIYVNGNKITDFDTETYPAEDRNGNFNHTNEHNLIEYQAYNEHGLNGYIAEVHFIDKDGSGSEWFTNNSAAANSSFNINTFGETGDYGEWKPIEVTGINYGTNGFYLPFKGDYTVEGFSAVTYTGNSTNRYIGGTGFQPDLTWFKSRSHSGHSHELFDVLRGVGNRLRVDNNGAEASKPDTITSFDSDGFSLGADADTLEVNDDGKTYVAWNWDMNNDSYGTPRTIEVGGNTNHSTTQEKIGDTSIRFDGTDDYLTVPDSSDWDFGTQDFTIEAWVRFDATGSSEQLFNRLDSRVGSNHRSIYIKKDSNDTLITRYGTGGSFTTSENASTETLAANTWYHIAVVRNNNGFRTYLNGSRLSSMDETSTVSIAGDTPFVFGAMYDTAWNDEFTGYMDEIRISNKCRYTGNFTAPTTAFTNDSNTLFLLHSDTTNGSTTFTDSAGAAANTDGSVTSYVAANPTYGQSIIKWTGNGTTGHGLSSAPEMIIVKPIDVTGSWWTWHKDLSNTSQGYLQLDATTAEATNASLWDNASPVTSTTINANTAYINNATDNYIAYCFHSVTGYSKFGSYTGNGSSTGPSVTLGFAPAFLLIKSKTQGEPWSLIDNVRPHTTAGLQNVLTANTNAAETQYSVDLNSNGFQIKDTTGVLNANSQTYIYMAFADTREYGYWLDQSGNNNDWTSNGITESDISLDSPSNNFATLNPLNRVYTGSTFSEGNLKITGSTINQVGSHSTMNVPLSGKWYAEFLVLAFGGGTPLFGINHGVNSLGDEGVTYRTDGSKEMTGVAGNTYVSSYGDTWTTGDVMAIAYDADSNGGQVTFYKNGVSQGVAFTGTNANITEITGQLFFGCQNGHASTSTFMYNFGQDSSFAGNKTAQGNQDGNSIGDFHYEPPSGHLALCTKNLPAVDVTPSEHFNTITYTGTDDDDRAITGVGFQPDFAWFKRRNTATNHGLFDVLRGANKRLSSNLQDAEFSDSNALMSFDSDGYTVSSDGTTNAAGTYVAWNWKANGSGSSNTAGSINSTVSVNTDAGFSIVSYAATGSNATVGHGLSKVPEMIIIKNRTIETNWPIYHHKNTSAPETDYIKLDTTAATADNATFWNDTAPTSSVFTIGTDGDVNQSGSNMIAYCFHSVDGYSKVGSYTGNGNADGTFVYTGFRPMWIMVKRADGVTHWQIHDTKRSVDNPSGIGLLANTNDSDGISTVYDMDIASNGFKLRATHAGQNTSGATYIYIAFAETPFKYSNAR